MKMKVLVSVLFIALVSVISYSMGWTASESALTSLNLRGVPEVWEHIQSDYLRVDEYDAEQMNVGFAKGLVTSLGDPHSSFFNQNEAEQFTSSLNSELKGIGAELTKKDGLITVVAPLRGTPADKAGLLRGDIIVEVDGEEVLETDDLFDVVSRIRGPEGTMVVLTVIHDGEFDPVEISIVRASIHVDAVHYEKKHLEGITYGYVEVSQFSEMIGSEFESAVISAKNDRVDGLLVDLRFNGGGYLDGAVDMLSVLLGEGKTAVVTRSRDTREELVTHEASIRWEGPLVVLVNDVSASASEIVAGAVQDSGVGKVVGVKTYGKGSVQEIKEVPGLGLLRLTIAEWLTPLERGIDKLGIEPDVTVPMSYQQFQQEDDLQIVKGVQVMKDMLND